MTPHRSALHAFGSTRPRRLAVLVVSATVPLVLVACGASVPDKAEAAAAVAKAIAAPLTRTLPASTYCMTANPDFTFRNMGQIDLITTFQNLKDKEPLYDAARAGIVRAELEEFPFNPAGRSPDPSCDAVHEQSKSGGLKSGQIRLAVVRMALTEKATSSGVQLNTPIEVATRELVDVTNIRRERGGAVTVTYTWRWKPTRMAEVVGYTPGQPQEATARMRRSDGGWLVEDAGVK